MTITIAPLLEADVEALSRLAAVIWRAHYPAIIGNAQTEFMLAQRYAPAVLRAEIERDGLWWDVLRDDGELIAFASSFASGTPGELKLDKLYVHPAHQRKGYGKRLIEHTVERARQHGFTTVMLAVNRHNVAAIAAYRKHGFDIREAVVKDIGSGFVMDDYIMVRPARCGAITNRGKPKGSPT